MNKLKLKWKINDNLLGPKEYCPVIRKTTELKDLLDWNIQGEIENLKDEYSPEIFKRASYYLYKKESKSSDCIRTMISWPAKANSHQY